MRGRTLGFIAAIAAALTFGISGPVLKPMMAVGWSPAAVVLMRVGIGALVLAPFTLVALRGRWAVLWRARAQVLAIGIVGVTISQLAYIAAVQRLEVGTAILVEYLAPIALVGLAWLRTRRVPHGIVIAGSLLALAGLVLVVGPGAAQTPDALGLLLALTAMAACAGYYLLAARPIPGLPGVAVAGVGLMVGTVFLLVCGLTRAVPMTWSASDVLLFGHQVVWFGPLLVAGVIASALAYVCSIAAAAILGSRLASFMGLLEVVAATGYAWLLLGEQLTALQLVGGLLILAGIGCVRAAPEQRSAVTSVQPTPARTLESLDADLRPVGSALG